MKLLFKFIALFVLIAVVPLAVSSSLMVTKSQEALKHEIAEKEYGIAVQASARVNGFISDAVTHVNTVAHTPGFESMNYESQRIILNYFMDSYPFFNEVSVIDANGMEAVRVSKYTGVGRKDLLNKSREEEYLSAIAGKTYISNVKISDKRHSFVVILPCRYCYIKKSMSAFYHQTLTWTL